MSAEPLKLLVVDDSRIFRGAVEDALQGRDDIRVVGSVWSGEKALEFIRSSPPDLVTLDINMPGQGGLDTLSAIQRINATQPDQPPIGVLLVSALTERGAAITIDGLERGAFDFVRKPDGPDKDANAAALRNVLLEKIDLYAQRRRRPRSTPVVHAPAPPAPSLTTPGRFQAVAIGTSTGGPEALARVLPVLTRRTAVPVFIVQHLLPGMAQFLAQSLDRRCDYKVVQASDATIVQPSTVYLAPTGRHMVVRRLQGQVFLGLNDQPPENKFRPSVDVLFRSVAAVYPGAAIGIILTGMGNDGAKGVGALKRSGAYIIAQDDPSSVVWGMPGAAVATNQVDAVLPLERIGPMVASLLGSRTTPCT
jgi:two-component system chemotaxis response regulator CheB